MLTEAKQCYLEAIRIEPSFAIAWSNLAGIFKDEVPTAWPPFSIDLVQIQ